MRPLLLALAGLGMAGALPAQTMRPFSTYRQLHGETRLPTRLEYAAGTLRVVPGPANMLYRMSVSYDGDRYEPLSAFDAGAGRVTLGLRPAGGGGIRVVNESQLQQAAVVELSPQVEVDLDVELGAAEADFDLGGLRIGALALKTGASTTTVRFSRPNAVRCRSASVVAGAAEVTMEGLGNSRCDEIRFEGGVGKVTLDFAGAWRSSSRATVRMAMGELTLRLPRQVGVRVTMDKFLSSFDPAGLIKRGAGYESANYAEAERKLDIALSTAMGGVSVEWVE